MGLHLLGIASDPERVEALAAQVTTGHPLRCWSAHPDQRSELPYRAVFEVASDDIGEASEIADVGLYVSWPRVVKPASTLSAERVIASFAMVRHPDLTHAEADAHWREVHGPVALRCHEAMCDYEQLSIVATLHGPPLDGLAMCAFPDRQTLSDRFFNDDEARRLVADDVSTFADPKRSLPRVVLRQIR